MMPSVATKNRLRIFSKRIAIADVLFSDARLDRSVLLRYIL